jgi:hypothetical protein
LGDAQRLGADFDHPDVEFSRVRFIVRHVGPIEISKGFAHQSKTYVPGAAAPAGCARSADPLIAHDFEAESLALIQAGHSCAFEGAYTDQHVNSTVVGLDETIALSDVEPSDGSNCHGASSHE